MLATNLFVLATAFVTGRILFVTSSHIFRLPPHRHLSFMELMSLVPFALAPTR